MKTDTIIKDLSKKYSENVQNEAIERLTKISINEIDKLVMPYNKDCWYNASIVIEKIGYPRIKGIICGLLIWLQDVNWPGAWRIIDVLCTVPKSELVNCIELTIQKAINDDMWLFGIKHLIVKDKIMKEDFNNKALYKYIDDIDF